MKETLAEYARIIIVIISFALVCSFILGGSWFNRLGKTADKIENDVKQTQQVKVFEQIENRENPILEVVGSTHTTGNVIDLRANIKTASAKSDNGSKTIDLKDYVEISCNSEYFDKDSKSLIPETRGIYKVTYTVKDSFGLSTTKIISIVVEDRL